MSVILGNYLSFFQYTLYTIPDRAFVESRVESNMFTPKTVAYTTIHHSLFKSTAVVSASVRHATLNT